MNKRKSRETDSDNEIIITKEVEKDYREMKNKYVITDELRELMIRVVRYDQIIKGMNDTVALAISQGHQWQTKTK